MLSAVGVKDWQTLERGAKLMGVTRIDGAWKFKPLRRDRRGAWVRWTGDDHVPATRPTTVEAGASAAELGAALGEALSGPTPTD